MDTKKRQFLKGAAVVGGAGLCAAGYSTTLKHLGEGIATGTSGKAMADAIHGNALEVEYSVNELTGEILANDGQRVANTMCFGCWTKCGVRARIDNERDEILRIAGNPYHPLSNSDHIDFETPVKEALVGLSGYQEKGLDGRSTACARGNAMLEQLTSRHRVTECLKRVGPRGSGKWQTISFEQLIEEVVKGGDLFGEGHVEGLREIRDLTTRLDPDNPEYGPRANQLLVSAAGDEGRDALLKRFTFNSFGTRNYGHHGSYCGFSYRAGSGALMDDLKKFSHVKPDWDNAEFLLFIGTSPQQSGNPFKRQARQLARARAERENFSYAVVSPMLPNSSNMASAPNNTWVPIRPATDSALAMGMLRWIIDNERYSADFLGAPNAEAAQAAGYRGFSNAANLVITDEGHPRYGQFVHASDLGLPFSGQAHGEGDSPLVVDAASGEPASAGNCARGELFVARTLDTAEGSLAVKSSLQLLRESARRFTLEEYSAECDVPVAQIVALADKFTSHGTRSCVISHGGTMSANGFYTAWAIMMLNAMIGNINLKGGAVANGGQFPAFGDGPRYDLKKFAGMVKPSGVFLSRSKFPYEKSSEYKRKQAAGQNPYPSREPWLPISSPLLNEHLTAALNGYPYRVKAWINHLANPVYGQQGLKEALGEKLRDPRVLPLMISIDSFINETSALSDYIVPDTLTYESWGWTSSWHGVMTKVSTGRWPVVEPRVAKTAEGEPVCMESFLIAVAKAMDLPGFGDGAVKAQDGSLHGIHRVADFSLYGAANVAFQGKQPVPEIGAEDVQWSGIQRILPTLAASLPEEEARRVAYLYARGGRFDNIAKARVEDDQPAKAWPKPLMIWNPEVGTRRNSLSGKHLHGTPTFYKPQLVDGTPLDVAFDKGQWPLLLSSYKSHVQSAMSIGSDRLRQVHPNNPVRINAGTAARLGIETGDTVRISTPNGEAVGVVECVAGIHPDCVAIEHGYGHKELGARDQWIDGRRIEGNPRIRVGINLNELSVLDPSRNGRYPLMDWVVGSAARQGLPARIEKV